MPVLAFGMTMSQVDSHLVAPKARAASRCSTGTAMQDFAGYRNDKRHDHNHQNDAGRKKTHAVEGALKKRQKAEERRAAPGLNTGESAAPE